MPERRQGSAIVPTEDALDAFRAGRMVILMDDEDRENEGDLCVAAERVTAEHINFMATNGRGLICLALTESGRERADLTQGAVCGDGLQCAFHRWTFGPDGACRSAPGHAQAPERRARAYPLVERWGFVWVFNGPTPRFDLPSAEPGNQWRALALPPQTIRCHPHLVLANGLDLTHYDTLHGFRFTEAPRLTAQAPHAVSVAMRGRSRSRFWRVASGTRHSRETAHPHSH
jgi:nitrite reductase/ring-hydroxylating ferredoxin subunit